MGLYCDDVIEEVSGSLSNIDTVSSSLHDILNRGDMMSLLCAISKRMPARSPSKAQDDLSVFMEKRLCEGSSFEDIDDLFCILWKHYGYDLRRDLGCILEVDI